MLWFGVRVAEKGGGFGHRKLANWFETLKLAIGLSFDENWRLEKRCVFYDTREKARERPKLIGPIKRGKATEIRGKLDRNVLVFRMDHTRTRCVGEPAYRGEFAKRAADHEFRTFLFLIAKNDWKLRV